MESLNPKYKEKTNVTFGCTGRTTTFTTDSLFATCMKTRPVEWLGTATGALVLTIRLWSPLSDWARQLVHWYSLFVYGARWAIGHGNWCIGTHYSSMEPAVTYSKSSPPPPTSSPPTQLLTTAVLQIIMGETWEVDCQRFIMINKIIMIWQPSPFYPPSFLQPPIYPQYLSSSITLQHMHLYDW